jgi:hypothetical protein
MAEAQSTAGQSDVQEVEYRLIPGFPAYRVGSDGSIWSRWQLRSKPSRLSNVWRLKKSRPTTDGYLIVSISRGGGDKKTITLHRLILLSFVGPRPKGMEARHLDGNKLNNRISNLQWGTPQENIKDRIAHGNGYQGVRVKCAVLNDDLVRGIRRLGAEGHMRATIARIIGCSPGAVGHVLRGESWKHVI